MSYRYGFNGKEMDPETYGQGNVYDYGFRIYNPRLGKFLSVDPLQQSFPWYSPYQFSGNSPILNIDLDGKETQNTQDESVKDNGGNPSNAFIGAPVFTPIVKKGAEQGVKQTLLRVGGTALGAVVGTIILVLIPKEAGGGAPPPIVMNNSNNEINVETNESPVIEQKEGSIVQQKQKIEETEFIYRAGANTDKTYTPREKKDTDPSEKYVQPGMSSWTTPERALMEGQTKCQELSVAVLRASGFLVIFDPGGHVTITVPSDEKLKEWASTRKFLTDGLLGQVGAHYLTKLAAKSRTREIRSK